MHNPEPNGQGAAARAQSAGADRATTRKPFSFYAELWVAAFDPASLPADPKRILRAYVSIRFRSLPLRHTYRAPWPPRRRER